MTSRPPEPRELVRQERSRIVGFLAARGARDVRLFGSVTREDDDRGSDIDLLVEFEAEQSADGELLAVLGLSEELSSLLGTRVDVVSSRTLRPEVRASALAEAVPL